MSPIDVPQVEKPKSKTEEEAGWGGHPLPPVLFFAFNRPFPIFSADIQNKTTTTDHRPWKSSQMWVGPPLTGVTDRAVNPTQIAGPALTAERVREGVSEIDESTVP